MDGKKTLHEFSYYYEKSETYIRRQFPRIFCMYKFQNMANNQFTLKNSYQSTDPTLADKPDSQKEGK